MTFMAWSEELETGIDIVDRQHRGLVDMLNQAAPILVQSSRQTMQSAGPLLDGLLNHAAALFRDEEAMMAHAGMDVRARDHHHALHAGFGKQLGELVQSFSQGTGVTGERLLSFLASWLVQHILGEDQAMARQFRALQAGMPAAQAYAEARGDELHPLSHALVGIYTVLTRQNRELLLANAELDASRAAIQHHNEQLQVEIAQHQQTKAQAGELLAQNTAILENAVVGIAYLKERHIVSCNRHLEEIFQYAPGELIGVSTERLYDSRETFTSIGVDGYAAAAQGKTFRTEVKLRHKDGSIFWGALSGRAIDPAAPQAGSIWIYADLTEQKLAQERVQRRNSLLATIVENFPGGISFVDANLRLGLHNKQFQELLEFPDALLEKPEVQFADLIRYKAERGEYGPGDSEQQTAAAVARAREFAPYRVERVRPDGTVLEIRGAPVPGGGMVNSYIDITERRITQDNLRKLALAVEQSPESIVITNLDAEIEYANAAFYITTGYSREEVIGKNPRVLKSGKTPRGTFIAMWAALTQGKPWKGQFYNRRKDGSEYVEFAIITPLRQSDGSISHYVGVQEDITEKKKIGLELDAHRHHLQALVAQRTKELAAAMQRSEAANLAKTRFLGTMSHELRTPMNAILGFSRLLHDQGLPAQQDILTRKIVVASERLLVLLNGIIDYAKLEGGGGGNVRQATFDLAEMLHEASSTGFLSARKKGLDTRLDIDPGLPSRVWGDAKIMQRILEQFISNSVKFTAQGSIRLSAAKLSADVDGQVHLRIAVSDTGIGIPTEIQAHLFQPFMQADDGADRKFEGIGLGLALSRELARLIGGEIGFESEPGQGSTFWMELALTVDDSLSSMADPVRTDSPKPLPQQVPTPAIVNSPMPDNLRATMQMLDKLLRAYDTRAATLLAKAAASLRPRLGERFNTLSELIDAFDYDQARLLLKSLQTDVSDGSHHEH